MALNPISTFKKLNDYYKDFLKAQFTFRNEKIHKSAQQAIDNECELLKGPFIEAHLPYVGEHSLKELVEQGVLNKNIKKAFTEEEYSIFKRYKHQEKAIKYVGEKKSIIVASGTGSGKTECFLMPVINELLNEIDNNTLTPGVRALIIYPMNALANDQMARLRECLKDIPEITFGRYIGETVNGDKVNIQKGRKEFIDNYKSKTDDPIPNFPLQNELFTRAEIENSPPHILVTNYAMLEYMLLRSNTQKIFNGKFSKSFKFLILDEAHTYKGAHGTEVAMLLRRLKETIFGKIDNCLTCIGTSATLGGGKDETNKVVKFASDLFCEKFTEDSIITSERVNLETITGDIKDLGFYNNLYETYTEKTPEELFDILSKDKLVFEIRKQILTKTMTIFEVADILSKSLNMDVSKLQDIITKVIEMAGNAISPIDGNPLINAKYHVFARMLEGGFIKFGEQPKVFTERRKEFDGYKVYELYNCMKCGQEYIIGEESNDGNGNSILLPCEDGTEASLFMVSDDCNKIEIDEDESEEEVNNIDLGDSFLLCPKCGRLYPKNCIESTSCCGFTKDEFVNLIKVDGKSKKTCFKCGKFNKGTIRKLTTGEDSAIELMTRKLYQLLPPEKTKKNIFTTNSIWGKPKETEENEIKGRKLLVFSDSRQDAAKFAVFIQNRYNDWLWKKIIYNEIQNMLEDKISFNKLSERCFNFANKNKLFSDSSMNDDAKKDFAKKQLMKEVLEIEPRLSLNRLGLISIVIDNINNIGEEISNHFNAEFNISRHELIEIMNFLFDSLRRQGCIIFPEGVDPTEDDFEPKNRNYCMKEQGGGHDKGLYFIGFKPSNNKTNKRKDYLYKFFLYKGHSKEESLQLVNKFFDLLNVDFFNYCCDSLKLLEKVDGNYYKLRLDNIYFSKKNTKLYVCKQCGETISSDLLICGKANCNGEIIEVKNNEDRGDYYRNSFINTEFIPMNAKEHTAQIASKTATSFQDAFKANNINLLSCSTTFEMGVDIGSLEAVVLRNVPPETSNYIQRAGRAGRRGSSAAFILTFAKRRSHDLSYYNEPIKMINGEIKAPYIELSNAYLIRRHIHSMIFSYLSKIGYDLRTASDLIGNDDGYNPINEVIYELLQKKPADLINSINIVVPNSVKDELGLDENWSFTKKLVDDNKSEDACLDNAIQVLTRTIKDFNTMQEEAANAKKYEDAERLKRVLKTYNDKDWITYLASANVLPRYGFPIYTVPLELNGKLEETSKIDLSRDLRMAITEYAPGTQVVANGKYWKPYALKVVPNKGWLTYDFAICQKCGKKYFYQTALGVERDDDLKEKTCCEHKLKYNQMVIPEFGFITKRNDKESKKLQNEAHYHSTLVFEGFLNNKQTIINDFTIGTKIVKTKYSPNGEMFAINGGSLQKKGNITGISFNICPTCGYVGVHKESSHNTPNGKKCETKLVPAYIGHHFISDALVITLPSTNTIVYDNESILYAIIEGASNYMDVDRREIGGAIWDNGETGINVTLFDTVPNGAGHVKRMQGKIVEILKTALLKVDGRCGCGEETCCYGCLRNYDNQIYHDTMSRGAAKRYLTWLLKK